MNEPLWPNQQQARDEAKLYPRRAFLWSPRTGKSRGTIEVISKWGLSKGVVVAPLLVCPQWSNLLQEAGHEVLDLYKGPLEARRRTIPKKAEHRAIVVNYDALAALRDTLRKYEPNWFVADESHWIKSPSAKRARAARMLGWETQFSRLLTGTPIPNHYGDLWGQMTIVEPEEWSKSYTTFSNRHLIRNPIYPSQITGYNDIDRIEDLLARGAHIVRREDIFGADQFQFVRRILQFDARTSSLYRKLAHEWIIDQPNLTAEHVLKRLVRLQQLTSGYLPDNEKTIHEVHAIKLDAVMADLDEIMAAGEKVVIFHRFTWEGHKYFESISKAYPGCSVRSISGSTGISERQHVINEVVSNTGSMVCIVQTSAGGIGISLAEAQHAFVVSSDWSFVNDKQAIDRIYKPGEPRVVTRYLMANTVDMAIERAITCKTSLHEAIMNTKDKCSIIFGPDNSMGLSA